MFLPKKIVKQNSTVWLIFPPWNNTCTLFSSTFHFFPFWPFLQRPGRDCLSTSIKIKPKVSASDKLNWWIKPVEISQSAGFSPEQQKTVFFKTDSITSWKIVSVGKCFHTEIQISKYKSSLALFPSLSRSGFSYFFWETRQHNCSQKWQVQGSFSGSSSHLHLQWPWLWWRLSR